jgi:hypothetical protein
MLQRGTTSPEVLAFDEGRRGCRAVERLQGNWSIAAGLGAALLLVGCRSDSGFVKGASSSSPANNLAAMVDAASIPSESANASDDAHSFTASREALRADGATGALDERMVGVAPPESTDVDAAPHVVQTVAPAAMSPMSPGKRLDDGEIPAGYQARIDEMHQIGERLAAAADGTRFEFDVIYNPNRAGTCRTESGSILVTSALLERLATRRQLAVALALEMTAHLREMEHREWAAEQSSAVAGKSEGVVVNRQPLSAAEATPAQIQRTASDLLVRAGFPPLDVAVVQREIDALVHRGTPSASEAGVDESEPRWGGPAPAAAN